jgi:hypothetical protein
LAGDGGGERELVEGQGQVLEDNAQVFISVVLLEREQCGEALGAKRALVVQEGHHGDAGLVAPQAGVIDFYGDRARRLKRS